MFQRLPTAQAVGTSASSAILVEASSGRVLYEHNSHDRRDIASITKLMTALVALESGVPLGEEFPVPDEAVGVEGSSVYLRPGERVTLEGLLYGLLLRSGNDAAAAIAIRCAGSQEDFAREMNRKARELGMADSHFVNPSGLTAEGHYSSAYDMALLARACLENETLLRIVSTKTATVGSRVLTNHNKLLWRYEGAVGMKTGYTEKAGRTLVSAARRGGMTLIAVTLNDPDDWRDHAALLDWGFAGYAPAEVEEGAVFGCVPVSGSLVPFVEAQVQRGWLYPVTGEEQLELKTVWDAPAVSAPVERGDRLGTLEVRCGGELVGQVPLVAARSAGRDAVPAKNPLEGLLSGIF